MCHVDWPPLLRPELGCLWVLLVGVVYDQSGLQSEEGVCVNAQEYQVGTLCLLIVGSRHPHGRAPDFVQVPVRLPNVGVLLFETCYNCPINRSDRTLTFCGQ